jgi:hypothetical protein
LPQSADVEAEETWERRHDHRMTLIEAVRF